MKFYDLDELRLFTYNSNSVTMLDNVLYLVSYGKKIYHVRDPKGFAEYHKKNPGGLKNLLANTMVASIMVVNKKQASRMFNRRHQANTGFPQHGVHAYLNKIRGNFMADYVGSVPLEFILRRSVRWLRGIIVDAYGLEEGAKVIQEAEREAVRKLSIGSHDNDLGKESRHISRS